MWRRITAAFDDDLKKLGANPAMAAPLTRWVLFNHLTKTQGMAGRRYADIVNNFNKYHSNPPKRTSKSADLEPTTNRASDDTLQRHLTNGTLAEFEERAAYAKRQYKRLMKLLEPFADPITGRNYAKDYLDTLCLANEEPPAESRPQLAALLAQVAKEFGIGERKRKIQSWRKA